MTNDELMSKTISYLRFPLTLGVVYIHFNICKNGFIVQGTRYGLDNPEWYSMIINFFSGVLPTIAVPLFFIISGFLFFYNTSFDSTAYKKKLKKRAVTLLIPYLIWNLIAIINTGYRSLPFLSSIFHSAAKTQIDTSLPAFLMCFWDNKKDMFIPPAIEGVEISNSIYPIDVPMWYVRDLIIAFILAPVIYLFIKKVKGWGPFMLGLTWYLLAPLKIDYPHQLITSFFFVSVGAYFSINRKNMVCEFRKLKYVPYVYFIVAIADLMTKQTEYHSYINQAGILLGIVTAVNITSLLIEREKIQVNEFLSTSSFFVYALHTFRQLYTIRPQRINSYRYTLFGGTIY